MEIELDVASLRANLRSDGRKKGELRELHLEKDSSYRADGSATLSHGNTEVITSIYGPKQCSFSNMEFTQFAGVNVSITYTEEKENPALMDLEYVIQKLLENVIDRSLFPRTEINVFVQVVCDDGAISFII